MGREDSGLVLLLLSALHGEVVTGSSAWQNDDDVNEDGEADEDDDDGAIEVAMREAGAEVRRLSPMVLQPMIVSLDAMGGSRI